ncbi:hypothetical protein M1293_00500 [Candidatus Parvarchaeota archaeon]|nr:hypothetical protein [Candidatus Parvarchaeota archaeon]
MNRKAVSDYVLLMIITLIILIVILIFYLFVYSPATLHKILPVIPTLP